MAGGFTTLRRSHDGSRLGRVSTGSAERTRRLCLGSGAGRALTHAGRLTLIGPVNGGLTKRLRLGGWNGARLNVHFAGRCGRSGPEKAAGRLWVSIGFEY